MNYYIMYDEKAGINYRFLFALYIIAERNKQAKLKNIVKYKSVKDLCQ